MEMDGVELLYAYVFVIFPVNVLLVLLLTGFCIYGFIKDRLWKDRLLTITGITYFLSIACLLFVINS